jgi:hypothetical protein
VTFQPTQVGSEVFGKPVELRIHYSSQQGSGFARITLARDPLNAK